MIRPILLPVVVSRRSGRPATPTAAGEERSGAPNPFRRGSSQRRSEHRLRVRSARRRALPARPEFVSTSLVPWAYVNGVTFAVRGPGGATDNAFIESFNGRLREDGLNQHRFKWPDEAKRSPETSRADKDRRRLGGTLGNRPPNEFPSQGRLLPKSLVPPTSPPDQTRGYAHSPDS